MKTKVGPRGFVPAKLRHLALSTSAVVVAAGIAGSALAAMNATFTGRDLILSRASTAAHAFSDKEVALLKGDMSDLENPTYKSIKYRLTKIRQDNPDTRFSYLVGIRNNGAFFFADSEPPATSNYSPPGQAYPDATPELLAAFTEEQTFIEGPVADSYGTWISALAPIVDQSTGKTIAILGIDVPAYSYFRQIAVAAAIPLLLAAIPLTVLLRNQRLTAKEQEVTELKAQFVSVASHELRSPLTGTLWGVQSLLKPKQNLTADQRETLMSVYNNTASSLATVNEILDFSIFERSKIEKLQTEPVNLVDVLSDVLKLFTLSAAEAGVTFKYVGSWPKHLVTKGDPNALKRAFGNIISNAIKYSPKGGDIELGFTQQGSNHIIGIRDHGIGIPKAEQRKVLAGYYRAANATKVKTYGTGMGLWITRMILDQSKGSLRLDSSVGKGTTIFVSLPVHKTNTH